MRDCLAEELRRLDPDEIYEATLKGLGKIVQGRAAAATGKPARRTAKAKASAKS